MAFILWISLVYIHTNTCPCYIVRLSKPISVLETRLLSILNSLREGGIED